MAANVIGCVCLNPAVDVTYDLPRLSAGESLRVQRVHRQAGGKGINVARVLRALGERPLVTGLIGTDGHQAFTGELDAAHIEHHMVLMPGPVRQTVTINEPSRATLLLEPGPTVTPCDWLALERAFTVLVDRVGVLVLSGSAPPGTPEDGYARLCAAARRAGAQVIIDVSGPPLKAALDAGPTIVKINDAEAGELIGSPIASNTDALDAARSLLALDDLEVVIISRGAEGFVAATGECAWHVSAPPVTGNPTGAGDSVAACVARGRFHRRALPEILREASTIAAATVAAPRAGRFSSDVARRCAAQIRIQEL